MNMLGKQESENGRPMWKRTLILLLTNPFSRILLFVLATIGSWQFVGDYTMKELYPVAQGEILKSVGLGFYGLSFFTIILLIALRFAPRYILLKWRSWLAVIMMITASQAVLGSVRSEKGITSVTTYGGAIAMKLWPEPIIGTALVLSLCFVSVILVWPAQSYKILKAFLLASARQVPKATFASLRLLGQSIKGILKLAFSFMSFVLQQLKPATHQLPTDHQAKRQGDVHMSTGPEHATIAPGNYPFADQQQLELPIENIDTLKNVRLESHNKPAPQTLNPPSRWLPPGTEFLDYGAPVSIADYETDEVARRIEETLADHGVEVIVNQVKPGPTVTLYGLTPGWIRRFKQVVEKDERGEIVRNEAGKAIMNRTEEQTRVKVDSIVAREKDLALALAAPSLRIQAPVPGESIVGIEVPNREAVLVALRNVLESEVFASLKDNGGLALGLGQGSGGDPIVADLRNLPHLLIAGATGSGKSICINTLIVSLASQVSPERLRMLLIDPKRVELTPYNGLPHLIAPVIVDTEPAVRALKGIMAEMFRRYRRLEELGVRNIEGYHRHRNALESMPHLVVAIDELADLMMAASYEVEQTLTRLAQLGRAAGIHLLVATQRPSVDVVTGLIKANFPSRIGFAVASQVDSRTILDAAGAERLLGRGDMLFLSGETPKPLRVQGAYVSDGEIENLIDFWKSQNGPPLPEFNLEPEASSDINSNSGSSGQSSGDDMMGKALELTTRYSHLSTSLLQRRLRIGYPRAARLMDQLEDDGIVATGDSGKSREVIRKPE
ncbi:MAG: DNA segregation ATPase FtsK/SpoIIIE [Chloroflexi bacterium]|jgi:hypothetical protein|nr:MAG: DNA segregation ATPase FtsK/SpoIIIE [Chloroflexota bacterium]